MFTGADASNASPGPNVVPYNSYRFNAMQWDPGSGQYNMGFRNYDPGLGSFISRDMYAGSGADMALTGDPFSGGAYAFGDANPISNIELAGHMFPAGGGSPCTTSTPGCPGYQRPNCWEGSYCMPQPQLPPGWSFQRSGPLAGVITHSWQQSVCIPGGARTGGPICWTQTEQQQFNVGTVCGGGARTGAPRCLPATDFLTPQSGHGRVLVDHVLRWFRGPGLNPRYALDAGVAAEEGLPEFSTDTAQLEASSSTQLTLALLSLVGRRGSRRSARRSIRSSATPPRSV